MKHVVIIAGLLLCLSPAAFADIVVDTLEPTKDTYIDAFNMDANHGFEDALTLWNEDIPQYFILIQFPLDLAYQSLPDTQELAGAYLGMNCYYSGGAGTANVTGAYDSWGEGTVNYNNMPDIFSGPTVTGTSIPDMAGGWFSADVTPIANAWLNGSDYIGFYVTAQNPYMSWDFRSREYSGYLGEFTPKLILTWNVITSSEETDVQPVDLAVAPFSHGKLRIDYTLPYARGATLTVYDASGAVAMTPEVEPGTHTITWEPENSGSYFVKLEAGDLRLFRKGIIVK